MTVEATRGVETGLVVADAPATARFFCEILGFTRIRQVELTPDITGPLEMGAAGRLIWLAGPDGTVVKFFDGGAGSRYRPPDQAYHHFLSLYVADLYGVLARATAEGAVVHAAPVTLPSGVRIAFVCVPGGHILELIQPPDGNSEGGR